MRKVLTIGEVLVEIVATTKGNGFLEAQPLVGPFPSGAPAIFIDQLGKLGTPCAIVSRVGGLPEVVGGREELIFTPGDYWDLADKLRAIHASKALADDLGQHCLAHARIHYDASKNGLALKVVLEKMERWQ